MKIIVLVGIVLFLPWIVFACKLIFLKGKLNRICEKMGYEIAWLQNPFPSALFRRRGLYCRIKAGERKYHVALLSAPHRLREYSFVSPDEVLIHHKIVVKIVGKTRRFAQLLDLPLVGSCKSRSIDLNESVPKGEEKILLFYPVSKDVTWVSSGKGKRFLGNGDPFWNGYRFFTRSGFFEELSAPGKYLRSVKSWEEY